VDLFSHWPGGRIYRAAARGHGGVAGDWLRMRALTPMCSVDPTCQVRDTRQLVDSSPIAARNAHGARRACGRTKGGSRSKRLGLGRSFSEISATASVDPPVVPPETRIRTSSPEPREITEFHQVIGLIDPSIRRPARASRVMKAKRAAGCGNLIDATSSSSATATATLLGPCVAPALGFGP